jgi:alginate O-acetyltransferase complex protein AlgI
MVINSLTFLTFFIVVYAYYLGPKRRLTAQNVLRLIASSVFFGYYDWRLLVLILISTLAEYPIGRLLERPGGTMSKGSPDATSCYSARSPLI